MEEDIIAKSPIIEEPQPTVEEIERLEEEKKLRAELVESGTKILTLLDEKAKTFYDIKFFKNYVPLDEETMRSVVAGRLYCIEFIESLRADVISLMNGGGDA